MELWTLENGVPSGEIGTYPTLSSIEGRKRRRRPETFAPCTGDNAIGESTARKWFSLFKEDRFGISNTPRSGRPSGFDEDRLNTLIHTDPRQCTRELENLMNCGHSTIVRYLHSVGKVQKSDVRVPHVLSQNQRKQRVAILCASLLARHWLARVQHRLIPNLYRYWWRQIVFLCYNIRKRKEWLSPNKIRISGNCSNFFTWHSIFSVHGSTHYLKMTKLQYVNSCTTIELQIKMTIDK